eukprot:1450411-Ditylum_brightwellii.AAC.1
MEARRRGIKKCCKVYTSGITSHPEIKKQRCSGDSLVKWRTICKLTQKINEPDTPRLSDTELRAEHTKIMRKYYQLKKKCGPMWSTLFEERIKALKLEGEVEEAKKLHNMLANEKEREQAARLRGLKEKENRASVCS